MNSMPKPYETLLNGSVSLLLAYYEYDGDISVLTEQKSADYPRFPSRPGLIGGNRRKGIDTDTSPVETLRRELSEECGGHEDKEVLTRPNGEIFLNPESGKSATYSPEELTRVKELYRILSDGIFYAGTYIYTMLPELSGSEPYRHDVNVFINLLGADSVDMIEKILEVTNNKPLIDNRKFGGTTFWFSQAHANSLLMHSAHDRIITHLTRRGVLPNSMLATSLEEVTDNLAEHLIMEPFLVEGLCGQEGPSYEQLEMAGLKYAEHS